MNVVIGRETDPDRTAGWSVNQAAFTKKTEANVVDAPRACRLDEVSLVPDA